jgi:hypothetical protein
MIRNIIWLVVSISIFSSFLDFSHTVIDNLWICVFRGTSHTLGIGIGDYCSLLFEPWLDKIILKLNNKGRKKKRWYIQSERK